MQDWHKIFPKSGVGKQMIQIVDWINQHQLQTKSVLDFGCGKGGTMQWLQGLFPELTVTGWDTGTEKYRKRPRDVQFDGIYSIDCFEHIELTDIPDVIENLRRISHRKTQWCHIIDLTPAKKTLPDGRNAHVTLQSPQEWVELFAQHCRLVEHCEITRTPDRRYGQRERCIIHCRP